MNKKSRLTLRSFYFMFLTLFIATSCSKQPGSTVVTQNVNPSATPTAAPTPIGTPSSIPTPTPTPYLPSLSSIFPLSYSSRTDWMFYVRDDGITPDTGSVLQTAAANLNLGQAKNKQGIGGRPVFDVAEWDYSAMYVPNNATDGSGLPRSTFPCFSSVQGCSDPVSESDAFSKLKSYYLARVAAGPVNALIVSTNGHAFLHHYAGEWGVDLFLSELGENVNGTQAHNAFARGASMQYQKPWGVDTSSWYGPSIRDYRGTPVWGANSSPVGGHSLSLTSRIFFETYMGGATFQMDEAGDANFFANENSPNTLSTLGQVASGFNIFAAAHPNRGTPFIPFGIVLDRYHGMGLSYWYGTNKSFATLPLDAVRIGTRTLFEAIWPNSFEVQGGNESQYNVPTPYGDTFDVLLETASSQTVSFYKALILSGHLDPHSTTALSLPQYLRNGGKVVIDASTYGSALLNTLAPNATSHVYGGISITSVQAYSVGTGEVIVVSDYSYWANVLSQLSLTYLPFQVSAGAQFLLNKLSDNHWIITLINNFGVTKAFMSDEVTDAAQVHTFTVTSQSNNISSVTVWRGNNPSVSGAQMSATVPSGQVAIYELTL